MDSNDSREAHWLVGCALPDDERMALLLAAARRPPSAPPRLALLSAVHAARGRGQDRVAIVPLDDGVGIVVADGAGGTGDGAAAAERVVSLCTAAFATGEDAADVLAACDHAIASDGIGLSTAVMARVRGGRVVGASVGDSEAWLLAPSGVHPLTERQMRKPLLGDGAAMPAKLDAPVEGTLLIATDGLFAYVDRAAILAASSTSLAAFAASLVAAARLPSGSLRDDIGLALCRPVD
jgi:hypothetical protein